MDIKSDTDVLNKLLVKGKRDRRGLNGLFYQVRRFGKLKGERLATKGEDNDVTVRREFM
jgi:hypothetical protein